MAEVNNDNPIYTLRDVMANALRSLLGAPEIDLFVEVTFTPWLYGDPPYVAIAQASPFIDTSEPGVACSNVARWEFGMFAGPPTHDPVAKLMDRWIEIMGRPGVLNVCVDDECWPEIGAHVVPPVVEEVGGARLYTVDGRPLVGSIVRVRTEYEYDNN